MTAWSIDSLIDFVEDLQGAHAALYLPLFGGAGPEAIANETAVNSWFEKFWDKVIPVLEARLAGHGAKFLAGTSKVTITDFKVFQTIIMNLDSNSANLLPQWVRDRLK